jgi:hypothetical protein
MCAPLCWCLSSEHHSTGFEALDNHIAHVSNLHMLLLCHNSTHYLDMPFLQLVLWLTGVRRTPALLLLFLLENSALFWPAQKTNGGRRLSWSTLQTQMAAA